MRDARLAKALRKVPKCYLQWGYRLARSFPDAGGGRVNLKRLHCVWRQCGLQVPMRRPRKKSGDGHDAPAHGLDKK
jgi:hypothetical protein